MASIPLSPQGYVTLGETGWCTKNPRISRRDQAKRLLLVINLDFHERHDPRGLARDVTNLGRWGNGNVEVALQSGDENPYVMSLVRQAFEIQMGNGEVNS